MVQEKVLIYKKIWRRNKINTREVFLDFFGYDISLQELLEFFRKFPLQELWSAFQSIGSVFEFLKGFQCHAFIYLFREAKSIKIWKFTFFLPFFLFQSKPRYLLWFVFLRRLALGKERSRLAFRIARAFFLGLVRKIKIRKWFPYILCKNY